MLQVPWPVIDTFDNVEDSLDTFNLLLNEVLDNNAPIRNIKVRNRPCPFMTEDIRSLMKIRDKWRKLARKTNDPLHWSGYKTRKREVKRELSLAEREFVADQIKNNRIMLVAFGKPFDHVFQINQHAEDHLLKTIYWSQMSLTLSSLRSDKLLLRKSSRSRTNVSTA